MEFKVFKVVCKIEDLKTFFSSGTTMKYSNLHLIDKYLMSWGVLQVCKMQKVRIQICLICLIIYQNLQEKERNFFR